MATISTVATRSAMAALATGAGNVAYLSEPGREGAFKWDGSNRSAAVGADTRQGVYVPPASDTSGASGAWVRVIENRVDVRWFGVNADNTNDDYAAFAAAIAMCVSLRMPARDAALNASTIYSLTPILSIPLGTYYLSDTLEIKGASMQIEAVQGSILRFPANTTGIRIQSHDTSGEGTASSTTAADNTILRGISLIGGGGTNTAKHGIWMRASAQVYNCNAANFPGDGIHIVADVESTAAAVHGNANGWTVEDAILVRNGRHGLYVQGGDTNAGTAKRVNALSNGRFGVYDASFLGNTHIGHHADSNGLVGAGPNTSPNSVPTLVAHNNVRYGVVIGQETAASTTTPGTNNAVWAPVGPGGTHLSEIPAWSYGTTYAAGGSYAATSPNAPNAFIGCYEEGSQGQHQIMAPSVIVGGMITGTPGASGLTIRNLNGSIRLGGAVVEGKNAGGATLTTTIGASETANDTLLTLAHSAYAPLGYRATFITSSYFFPFAYNGQSSSAPFAITTPATVETFGRPSAAQPNVFAVSKLAIANRVHSGVGSINDLSGEVARGEIYYYTSPSAGGKLGLVVTTGGTIGSGAVLKEFGAIDS